MWGIWLYTAVLAFSVMTTIPHTAYLALLARRSRRWPPPGSACSCSCTGAGAPRVSHACTEIPAAAYGNPPDDFDGVDGVDGVDGDPTLYECTAAR